MELTPARFEFGAGSGSGVTISAGSSNTFTGTNSFTGTTSFGKMLIGDAAVDLGAEVNLYRNAAGPAISIQHDALGNNGVLVSLSNTNSVNNAIGLSVTLTGAVVGYATYSQQNGNGSLVDYLLTVGTGDVYTLYNINGAGVWSVGIDNSVSDNFVIAGSNGPGGGADFLTITSAGAVGFGQAVSLTIPDSCNIVFNTGTGTKLGTATDQKIGVYNATPIAQRSGAAQAAVVTTPATNVAPYGYTQAQADAIVTLVNELRAWAVAQGWIKGSA